MQPPVHPVRPASRDDDYRVRPAAESKSWAPRVAEADWTWDAPRPETRPRTRPETRNVFTHNVERYSRPVEVEASEPDLDVEPQLAPPPRWMLAIAGAAVAALMGALLGGFMHV